MGRTLLIKEFLYGISLPVVFRLCCGQSTLGHYTNGRAYQALMCSDPSGLQNDRAHMVKKLIRIEISTP